MKLKILAGIALIMSSCIGTDVLDDPMQDPILAISEESVELLIGESATVVANYTNQYGLPETIDVTWNIENSSIATLDTNGEIVAISAGQTNITASFGDLTSTPTIVTVVGNLDDVAQVVVESPVPMLSIGESVQLSVSAFNLQGTEITVEEIFWDVSDESVVSITQTGLLTAHSNGSAQITATVDNIQSVPITIVVGSNLRVGEFNGANGYNAEGDATLFLNDDGDLILELSSDFDASFALGTFIYLSNFTSGSDVRGSGLDLGEITEGGSHTFNVSSFNPSADLDTYEYCIVLCKPASITFGLANFNEP